jgi:hypothetical protein
VRAKKRPVLKQHARGGKEKKLDISALRFNSRQKFVFDTNVYKADVAERSKAQHSNCIYWREPYVQIKKCCFERSTGSNPVVRGFFLAFETVATGRRRRRLALDGAGGGE